MPARKDQDRAVRPEARAHRHAGARPAAEALRAPSRPSTASSPSAPSLASASAKKRTEGAPRTGRDARHVVGHRLRPRPARKATTCAAATDRIRSTAPDSPSAPTPGPDCGCRIRRAARRPGPAPFGAPSASRRPRRRAGARRDLHGRRNDDRRRQPAHRGGVSPALRWAARRTVSKRLAAGRAKRRESLACLRTTGPCSACA